MASIKELVAERLTSNLPQVRERVLGLFVEEELEKRTKAVVGVVRQLDQARTAGYKLKPDDAVYHRDGSVLSEGYKKETVEAIKKNKELQDRLLSALDKALDEDNPDFEQVLKLAANHDATGQAKG